MAEPEYPEGYKLLEWEYSCLKGQQTTGIRFFQVQSYWGLRCILSVQKFCRFHSRDHHVHGSQRYAQRRTFE